MAANDEDKREPRIIRIPDPKPGDLTFRELEELEERAAAGDEDAQARVDEAKAQVHAALQSWQPAMSEYLRSIRATLAKVNTSPLLLRDVQKVSSTLRAAEPALRALEKAEAAHPPSIAPGSRTESYLAAKTTMQSVDHELETLRAIQGLHSLGLGLVDHLEAGEKRNRMMLRLTAVSAVAAVLAVAVAVIALVA